NVPESATLERLAASTGGPLWPHQPRWKQRVPRDRLATWDFDDVRDHYLGVFFGVDPQRLRIEAPERYLQLSLVTSAETMAAALAEWRRSGSRCHGALIWCLRDLWPGAGWGLIDACGEPKAAYYALARVCRPIALFVSDEGVNGLAVHVINEAPEPLHAVLTLRLFRGADPVGTPGQCTLELAPRTTRTLAAADLFDGFLDLSYAYRFGPPPYDVLHATLVRASAGPTEPVGCAPPLAQAFHFPTGVPREVRSDIGLAASALAA